MKTRWHLWLEYGPQKKYATKINQWGFLLIWWPGIIIWGKTSSWLRNKILQHCLLWSLAILPLVISGLFTSIALWNKMGQTEPRNHYILMTWFHWPQIKNKVHIVFFHFHLSEQTFPNKQFGKLNQIIPKTTHSYRSVLQHSGCWNMTEWAVQVCLTCNKFVTQPAVPFTGVNKRQHQEQGFNWNYQMRLVCFCACSFWKHYWGTNGTTGIM